jgi:hypothetical protein
MPSFAWSLLALWLFACDHEPAPSPALRLTPSAGTAPPSVAPPPPSTALVVPRPTRVALSGVAACDPSLPKNGGRKAKILGVDEIITANERLRPALYACLAQSLHERTTINLSLGIQPNGRVCGATLDAAQLSAGTLTCLSLTLQSYRFPEADTLSEVVFLPRFEPASRD